MKQIQWFPGHMFKSFKQIREKLKLMDILIVLLDARLPESSMNPELLKILKLKPTIILFNKMDLADENITQYWMNTYKNMGYHTMKIDAASGKNVQRIHQLASEILKDKITTRKQKGLKIKPFKTMILGIPNVGKSTLINQLTKSNAAKTGNTPGVTKAQQWIKLSDEFELLDTPGVLWPKFDDSKVGYHLAITGAIKDKILPTDDIVFYAMEFLKAYYPDRIDKRYDLKCKDLEFIDLLDHIGKFRGALQKGQSIDYDRVYQIILTDIRNKNLGGLTFDRPKHV